MSKKDTTSQNKPNTTDERNLVEITDADVASGVEDRAWLFWERNKGGILFGIIAAFVAVLGMEGFDYMRQQDIAKEQAAYLDALENDTTSLFVINYPESSLSGLIWLKEADAAYSEEDYQLAAENYNKAATILKETPMGTRARIGYGLSLYKQDNVPSARNALAAITIDATVLDAQRAEANYHLAVIALERSEPARAIQHLDAINALGHSGVWNTRAEILRLNAPELHKAETTTEILPAEETES